MGGWALYTVYWTTNDLCVCTCIYYCAISLYGNWAGLNLYIQVYMVIAHSFAVFSGSCALYLIVGNLIRIWFVNTCIHHDTAFKSFQDQEFNLMNAVYAVKGIEDWKAIGLYLGLSIDELNIIQLPFADHIKRDNERMKIEVLQYWGKFDSKDQWTLEEFTAALSPHLQFATSNNPFTKYIPTAMSPASGVSHW